MDNERDLLKACSLNKHFRNEVCTDVFFYNRIALKYPELLDNKPKNKSWKQYYLEYIREKALMEEREGREQEYLI